MIYCPQLHAYLNNLKIWVTLTSLAVETVGIVVEIVAVEAGLVVEEVLADEATVQNKCFRQFAANAVTLAKYHSDQAETGLFFAVIVSKPKVAETTDQVLLQKDLTALETATWAVARAVLQITARSLQV